MESSLQLQRPLNKSVLYSVPSVTVSRYSAWRREYAQNRISFRINATSRDFSRRTNKRVPYPRSDGSVSMGFMTRIKVGTRNRRKDRINTAEEGDSITQEPSKYAIVEEAGFRMDCFSEDDFYLKKNVTDEGVDEIVEGTPIGIPESAYGGIGGVGDKVVELLEKEGATENEMGINSIAKDTRELRKKETTFTKENGKSGSFSMKDVDGNEIGVSSGVTESKESPKKETASAIGIPELAYDGMSGVSGKVVELLEKEGATENEMGINSIAKDTRELRKKETTFTKENGKSGSFSMKHVDDNEIGVSSGVKESKELPKKEIASAIGIPELAYNGIGGVGGKVVELLEKEGATENEMGINSIVKDTRELRKKGTTFAKENGKFGGFSMKDVDGNEIGVSSGVKESKELPKKETASAKENGNFGSFSTKNVDGNEIGVGSVVKDSKECPKKETASAKENGSFDDFKKKLKEKVAIRLQKEREANLQRQEIEQLAEQNLFRGNKLFVWPQVVKAGQDIEVFLNRSLSTLNNEPDVFIMGAFNDWRLKSFRVRLNKTHLNGDWWSLQINVPKEAYKMDFVFFNGRNVYDNNETKDFCIPVEGKMDAIGFDNFLLEEKRRELEELALEQAERKRQEKEKRRIEAEKAATEADKAQAKMEAEKRRETLQQLRKNAVRSIDNVWHIEPREFNCGDSVRLYYNRSSGPLAHATELWIHGGHNKWKDGLNITEILVSSERKDGDWWYANVIVPDQAIVLDWVFANGPPQEATLYDNNNLQDFHALVTEKNPGESYWVEEEQHIFQKLQEERKIREEYILTKAERTSQMRAEKKERTLKSYLLSQKNIVYTEPLDVQAGSTVTVFYNHTNTVLNGKPEVWLRCSFNRWTHRMGPLQPKKMFPTNDGSLLKARVNVPLDTYMMDFVFSESGEGGAFDNNNGMDYHLPVFGGVAKQPPMHIVHIALEMAPIAKVGGLGDVVTSLSRAVQEYNHNVNIVLPKYDCMNLSHVEDLQFHKSYDWGGIEIKVWQGKVEGLSVYFLDPQNGFFRRGCIYGCNDDAERFGFFCHAALEFLLQSGMRPDIIHCHDWSSAPVAWLYKEQYKQYGLNSARVVFTIHNLEFGQDFIGKALTYSDKATTVSPTYSKEVSGSPVISPHLYKFHGILNGIDPDIWDPYNDKFIPVCYTPENVVEGKRAAKEALQQRLGLKKSDLPLVGIITRLTHQKGIHLIKHAIRRTLERGGQVVLLGSAPDPRIQNDFVNLSNDLHSAYGDRARLCLTYDEPLSHLIYAGSDFMLVPSIFEPCGLTQLTAMRYGSVPVVRKTGGLYDTVFDVDNDKERAAAQGLEPNGFSFDGADEGGVDYALNRAISAWYDGKGWFNSLCKKVMEQDWSWNRPALDYLELYHAAHKN